MRRALLFLLVGVAFATSTATAQVRVRMEGKVTDILGQALVGATVSEGQQSTLTDLTGHWELTVDPALVNTISASKPGYVTVSTMVAPLAQDTVDFALPFKITPKLTPTAVSVLPGSLNLEALSPMPPTGNCMIAEDSRQDGAGPTMTYTGTDANGVSRWIGGIPLPAGTPGGAYRVTFEGRNCSTLKTLTDRPAGQYIVDGAPPSIGLLSPSEGRMTIGVVSLPSRDGTTRVLGPVWVIVDASDDVGLGFGSIEVTPSAFHPGCNENGRGATSYRYVCGPFLFLRPGAAHTLNVRVQDIAGKFSEVTLNFRTAGGGA